MKTVIGVFAVLICLLLFGTESTAQNYRLTATIDQFKGKFTTDPLGNVYRFVSGDIFKHSPQGELTATYSSREFGDISELDASNPMKILAVFRNFSRAVVLDASLSANYTINLQQLPASPEVKLICLSRQQGYWIYDPATMTVKLLSDQLEVISEGTSLRQAGRESAEPTAIFDTGNWILLLDKNRGVIVFDRFGTYFKTIYLNNLADITVISNHEFLYKEDIFMMAVDIQKGITRKFELPGNNPENEVRVEGGRIFIRKGEQMQIFAF